MAKLLSGRLRNLNVGISSYTEDSRVFTATGNAFISGILTATSYYGDGSNLTGVLSGDDIETRNLKVTGIGTISGLTYPTTDGTYNQVLATDGSGTLAFLTIPGVGGVIDWTSTNDFGLITQEVTVVSDLGGIEDSINDSQDLGEISVPEFDLSVDADLALITEGTNYINDWGLITDSRDESLDFGNFVTAGILFPTSFVLPSYTVSTLPAAIVGGMIFVTDETGGSIPAFSDGTNWRRVTDAQIVS